MTQFRTSQTRTVPTRLAVFGLLGTAVVDGGLLDTMYGESLEAVGIPRNDPVFSRHLHEMRDQAGMSTLANLNAVLVDPARAEEAHWAFEDAVFREVNERRIEAAPGAELIFEKLRGAGIRVCIVTGLSKDLRSAILSGLGWNHLIDLALSPGEGYRDRPRPDLILRAVTSLEIDDVRATAVIGDAPNDLLAGTRAGAGIVAGVPTGSHTRKRLAKSPHTHMLDTLTDFVSVIDAHASSEEDGSQGEGDRHDDS